MKNFLLPLTFPHKMDTNLRLSLLTLCLYEYARKKDIGNTPI